MDRDNCSELSVSDCRVTVVRKYAAELWNILPANKGHFAVLH